MAVKKIYCFLLLLVLIFSLSLNVFASEGSLVYSVDLLYDPSDGPLFVSSDQLFFLDGSYSFSLEIIGSSSSFDSGLSYSINWTSSTDTDLSFLVMSTSNNGILGYFPNDVPGTPFTSGTYFIEPSLDVDGFSLPVKVRFNLYDYNYVAGSDGFLPSVSSGHGAVLSWVGIVLGSLLDTSGPLFPLVLLLVVGVSISALFFVIRILHKFIWGY